MRKILTDELFERAKAYHQDTLCSELGVAKFLGISRSSVVNLGLRYGYSFKRVRLTIKGKASKQAGYVLFLEAKRVHQKLKCGRKQVCRALGIGIPLLEELSRRYNYSFARWNSYNDKEREEIAGLVKVGITPTELSKMLNVTYRIAFNLMKRYGEASEND